MRHRNKVRFAKLFPMKACTAGLLAVFICAGVTWPIQEYAQQPNTAEPAPAVSTPASSLVNQSGEQKLDLQTLAFNWRPSNGIAGLTEGSQLSGAATLPVFNVPKLADGPDGGAAASSSTTEKGHIRKGYLVLGILGVGVAAVGAGALSTTLHPKKTNNALTTVNGDLHTTGEVMIPAGAAVAALGFIFAFRHH